MGGELSPAPEDGAPRFLIHVAKDPLSANLDRVQVIKGWIDSSGATHERIFDVAATEDRARDAQGAFVPVGNTVDPYTDVAFALYQLNKFRVPTPDFPDPRRKNHDTRSGRPCHNVIHYFTRSSLRDNATAFRTMRRSQSCKKKSEKIINVKFLTTLN